MGVELGLQLYSVRDELAKDFVGTLEKVAEIGYENLELFFHFEDDIETSIGGLSSTELREELDRLGMKAVSAHIAPAFLEEEYVNKMIEFIEPIGTTKLGVAIAFFENKQDVLGLSQQMNQAGQMYKENGLQLYYHNHFQEFQKFDGQYVMDIILENTDEDLVKVEFDTYWALRGGVEPVPYLKKLGGRCDLLHQKDLPASVDPVNMFEKIGHDATIDMELMHELHNVEDFTEIGKGTMNIPEILETFKAIPEAKYVFVEQDWTTINQLESVEISYKYMSQFFE